jgi:putative protease
MNGVYIGEVLHYYNRIGVAVLDIIEPLCVGDMVHILGHTSDHRQQVKSLQIELHAVEVADPGQDVALKVDERVRRGDKVYKIEEPA